MTRRLPVLLCLVLLVGCALPGGGTAPLFTAPQARVSEAQACAIGYDLSRKIYERVSLRRTVLVAPRRAAPCERHAIEYLRRAGFMIAAPGQGGAAFNVNLTRIDADTVSATAQIGRSLRISRLYQPVATGVRPAGPPAVQHLDADAYASRQAAR